MCTQLNYLRRPDGKYTALFGLLTQLKGGQEQFDAPIAEDVMGNLPSRIILMLKASRESVVQIRQVIRLFGELRAWYHRSVVRSAERCSQLQEEKDAVNVSSILSQSGIQTSSILADQENSAQTRKLLDEKDRVIEELRRELSASRGN